MIKGESNQSDKEILNESDELKKERVCMRTQGSALPVMCATSTMLLIWSKSHNRESVKSDQTIYWYLKIYDHFFVMLMINIFFSNFQNLNFGLVIFIHKEQYNIY